MKNFYITTPIYYVNAHPHLGHAYTTIVADTVTRLHQAMGEEAFFITGTDEHGDKIVQAAEKAGKSPEEFTTEISSIFKQIWPQLHTKPERFVRTTSPEHAKVVQEYLQRVYDAGDIYFGEYGGHYCYGCERFYTEKELENGLCPQHQAAPEYISEKNYFFRMSKYASWLREYILENPDFIRPEQYRNEVLALLESGELDDLCISRPKSRLSWGIELPFDSNYVCYVWFDALLSYITALGGADSQEFATYWPHAEHLVAKDILKPHAIFWPTMLKAGGLPLFRHLNVHGYWLVSDMKMSKTIGNVVAPLDMAERYGIDAFRYFLLRDMHFGHDGSFSEQALIGRFNSDLANDLGNLFSRVLSMTAKFCNSTVPQAGSLSELEEQVHEQGRVCMHNFQTLCKNMRFSHGIEALWDWVRGLNKYVDTAAPWALAKNNETERLHTVLYTLLECMRKIALHTWPLMPAKAEAMLEQLGVPFSLSTVNLVAETTSYHGLAVGTKVAATSNLFPRIDLAAMKEQNEALQHSTNKKDVQPPAKSQAEPAELTKAVINYDDFAKLDLRVGTVVTCEQHPNADKLLCLQVDLGEEQARQIISGLAEFYAAEDLVDKQVVVVANLAPRKLRGLQSHGMILTADQGERVVILAPTGLVLPGAGVS